MGKNTWDFGSVNETMSVLLREGVVSFQIPDFVIVDLVISVSKLIVEGEWNCNISRRERSLTFRECL